MGDLRAVGAEQARALREVTLSYPGSVTLAIACLGRSKLRPVTGVAEMIVPGHDLERRDGRQELAARVDLAVRLADEERRLPILPLLDGGLVRTGALG